MCTSNIPAHTNSNNKSTTRKTEFQEWYTQSNITRAEYQAILGRLANRSPTRIPRPNFDYYYKPMTIRRQVRHTMYQFPYASLAQIEECGDCPVCMEPFEVRNHWALSLQPSCKHVIGASCLQKWLESDSNLMENTDKCPICRQKLTTEEKYKEAVPF